MSKIYYILSIFLALFAGYIIGYYKQETKPKPKYVAQCTERFKGDYAKINECLDYYERMN